MDSVTNAVMKRVQTQLSEVLESAVILGVPMVDHRPMLAIYGYTDDLKGLSKMIHAKMEGTYAGPEFGPLPGTCTAEVLSRAHAQLMEVLETAVVAAGPTPTAPGVEFRPGGKSPARAFSASGTPGESGRRGRRRRPR